MTATTNGKVCLLVVEYFHSRNHLVDIGWYEDAGRLKVRSLVPEVRGLEGIVC